DEMINKGFLPAIEKIMKNTSTTPNLTFFCHHFSESGKVRKSFASDPILITSLPIVTPNIIIWKQPLDGNKIAI
ncbi:19517_t:CDS:1, partial [Gigaspora rosea]